MPNNQEVRLPAVLNERLLEIPDYQRPYAWQKKQLEDLWEDLDLLGQTGSHYAGTLVLRDVLDEDGEPKASEAADGATLRHCEVVDGQQRLTTCLLLLDRVRRRLEVLAKDGVENAAEMARRIRHDYGMVSIDKAMTPRLRLGAGLNPYWVDISLGDEHYAGPGPTAGQERLRDAAAFFDAKLDGLTSDSAEVEFDRLRDLQRRITAGLGFLVYEVSSSAEVGVIFETLNERGRDLSNLEKTKNYLLYLARSITDGRGEQLAELINSAWADIFTNLAGQGLDADEQLLRAHWLATQNPDRREWKQIASIKRRFDRSRYISGATRIVPVVETAQGADDAWDRLDKDLRSYVVSLRQCSHFLAEMFDGAAAFEAFASHHEESRRRSSALQRSGVVALYRPLLFAARLSRPTDGEFYSRLVDICERYSARVFVIRQRRLNAGESRLLRLANDLYTGAVERDTILRELAAVIWRYASDDELAKSLEDPKENWYVRRGHKYFLYEYELHLRSHQGELEPLSEFTAGAKEQKTTEHVLPQHPKADAACWWDHFNKAEHAELVHALGNLVLTYDNSAYSNKCFGAKRGVALVPGQAPATSYAQADLKQEQRLVQYEQWTPAAIEARQKELATWALKRWAVTPPTSQQLADDDPEIEPEEELGDSTAA